MPVQGMDRLYLGERHGLHAVAHLFLKDPDAGAFERLALNLREKSLAGGDGRLIDLEIAKKCHEVEDPMEIKESEAIYGIAHPYAMHRMMDAEAPEPTPLDELMRKFDGVRVFPHSGFAFHRHARGQTSLSWRNHFIALPFPRDGVLTIGPSRASVLAQVTVKDRAPGQVLRALSIDRKDDGFAALMVVDRDQETVRQRVLFASLPNGDMLCDEGLTALARCTVERVQQGFLRIVNENYPAYEGNCNGYRILHHPDGKERFEGFPSLDPGDDISFDLSHPGWLNVDDRMGLVFRGSGATRYLNRHFYPPFSFRAVADDLFLSLSEDPKECRPDETVAELSLLACPGQPSGETPFRRLIRCVGSPDSVCLITEGFLLAGNFGSHRAACAFPVSREETVPLFPGVARLDGTRVEYTVRMEGEQAVYLEQIASIRCDGSVKVEAVAGGGLYLVNEGTRGVRAIVRREGREEPFDLPPGALRSA